MLINITLYSYFKYNISCLFVKNNEQNRQRIILKIFLLIVCFVKFPVNGLGGPGVLPPFALGLGTPLTGGYGGGLPSLGAFALASTGALGASTPALRGLSNVLLVSNLNEEVDKVLVILIYLSYFINIFILLYFLFFFIFYLVFYIYIYLCFYLVLNLISK